MTDHRGYFLPKQFCLLSFSNDAAPDATRQLQQAAGLDIANFALREPYLPPQMPAVLLNTLIEMGGEATAKDLLQRSGNGPAGQRALSWLCKFGIVEIRPS